MLRDGDLIQLLWSSVRACPRALDGSLRPSGPVIEPTCRSSLPVSPSPNLPVFAKYDVPLS